MKNIKVFFAVLALAAMACVCSSTPTTPPEKIGEATTAPSVPVVTIYKVGEIIQIGSSTITLNSATFNGAILDTNFTIENNGTEEMAISSIISFSAKDDSGTKLEEEIFDCGSSIGGSILPGDKTKGSVCWKGFTSDTVKIYYTPDLFSSQTVVWEVSK